ncbi:DUF1573 domain-containing protein [Thermoflexibacter ruber]|uniref:DUF1573 domain-containing protein n=1 Tax=Thermoflexibacter ruber TaxID=1003 RepID=A0A1I2FYW7_9BACT|nr:DUF1573 domain-containing protein [Thermoflexibacter ruber]SFF09696.1 Protein of unknown function [Thermoflexibacter ruber]
MRYCLFLSIVSVLLYFSCNLRKSNTEKETSQVDSKHYLNNSLSNNKLDIQIQANEKNIRMYPILYLPQKDTIIQVKKESTVSIKIPFKNNGNNDLILNNVTSNCGCTIADFPQTPIRVGVESYIEVHYSSHGKNIREENQPIIIESNSEKRFAKFNIKIIISE